MTHRCLPGGEQLPLFRLRYGGSAHSFGFAIYSAARERYEDAVLLTGFPTGARKKHSTPPASFTSPHLQALLNVGTEWRDVREHVWLSSSLLQPFQERAQVQVAWCRTYAAAR